MHPSEAQLVSFIQDAEKLLSEIQGHIETTEFWIRRNAEVDMVLGGHFTRIMLSTRTSLDLCEKGNLFDASTIARAVLEHFVSLAYLLWSEDLTRACAHFAFSGYEHFADRHEALVAHYPGMVKPEPKKAEAARAVSRSVDFETKMRAQIDHLQKLHPSGIFDFLWKLPYGDYSVFCHPRPAAIDMIRPEIGSTYTCSWPKYFDDCGSVAQAVLIAVVAAAEMLLEAWSFEKKPLQLLDKLEALFNRHPGITPSTYLLTGLPDFDKIRVPAKSERKPKTKKKSAGQ